ncbi:uncharacterized protein LOC143038986 [Oratosquilla oratoria]|uniref:uncharacterized protein LOC143038986 n=1 Tax=Oratosquilla oratoria TaxID=337810 RepID=UPI003F76BF10
MIEQDILEHSISELNSPIYVFHKHGGFFRSVVDFRKLNKLPIPERHPLSHLHDILNSIGNGFNRRFIKGYASTAAPLTALLKKNTNFNWTPDQEKAFDALKEALTTAPVLAFPAHKLLFTLYTDACYIEIILGYEVHIHTDNQPILHRFKGKQSQSNLHAGFLQEFIPIFHFAHGKANVVADALRRHVATICQLSTTVNLRQARITAAQQSDPLWKHVIYFLTSGDTTNFDNFPPNIENYTLIDELLYHNTTLKNKHESNRLVLQLVVPTELIPEVLNLVHNSHIAGHPGKDKCLTQARLQ